jgi:hypothetical protein
MGDRCSAYSVLMGRPEAEGPLGRPRHKWEDNTSIYVKEIDLEGVG